MYGYFPPSRYVQFKMLNKQRYGTLYIVLYIVTITDHFSFYIDIRYCVDNEIYWIFQWSLKTRCNEVIKIQLIFHTLSVYNKFNPIKISTRILYGPPQNCSWFLWQLWRLGLAAQRSLLYNNVLKEIIKMIWTVCIEGMGGWRNSRKCVFVT
jgi:hypothetical protein